MKTDKIEVDSIRIRLTIGLTGLLFTALFVMNKFFPFGKSTIFDIINIIVIIYASICGFYFVGYLIIQSSFYKYKEKKLIGVLPISDYWKNYFYDSGVDMFTLFPLLFLFLFLWRLLIDKISSLIDLRTIYIETLSLIILLVTIFLLAILIKYIHKKLKYLKKKRHSE